MCPEQKELYKVFRAGGRVFPVYLEYDEQLGESNQAYRHFEEHPKLPAKAGPLPQRSRRAASAASPTLRLVLQRADASHQRLHVQGAASLTLTIHLLYTGTRRSWEYEQGKKTNFQPAAVHGADICAAAHSASPGSRPRLYRRGRPGRVYIRRQRRTYVPLRFISETLGATVEYVEYDEMTRLITIRK
ncbi:MAG: stalk domain-containing protein [Syntrophomonadaceae bacterium]|jgi:hypothetical protein